MGAVYLAELVEEQRFGPVGTRVAIKVLHSGLLNDEMIARRFQQEAELGMAVDHPSVVKTLDAALYEVDGRQHACLVLEYVEGRTLVSLLRELGTLPEALLRQLALQLSRGLAAVHEAGAVHRDLKPSNVVITPQHEVKLMDLGIARVAATELTRVGDFVGTQHYAAPEQFEAGEVGPAADLYALGVVLYEAATGVQPFGDDDFRVVMQRHFQLVPRRAGELQPELSPFFEELLVVLLEKEPERRPGDAHEVERIVEEGENGEWWKQRQTEGTEASLPASLRRLGPPSELPMLGRDAELEVIRSAWTSALDGEGGALLIRGEAGVGKSRLVEAFLRGLVRETSEPAYLLHGRFERSNLDGGGALGQSLLHVFGRARLPAALERMLSLPAELAERLASWLAGEDPAGASSPLPSGAIRDLHAGLVVGLARERPVIWAIEDIHLAGREDLELLRVMTSASLKQPVLLLLTGRPELVLPDRGTWSPLSQLELERLDVEVAASLARRVLGEEADEATLRQVARRSEGNPYFLFEFARDLSQCKLTTPARAEPEAPGSVRELLVSRLADLAEDDRRLLDVGALVGHAFDPLLVARVLERDRLEVLQSLATIARRGGVLRAEGNGFRFDHHVIQEVLHQGLPEVLAGEYHRRLAEARAEVDGVDLASPEGLPGATAAFLAEHLLEAGEAEAAVPLLRPAVEFLARSYRTDPLLDLVSLAVSALGDREPALRCDLLLKQAEALDLLGLRVEQQEAVESAIAVAQEAGDLARVASARAWLGWLLLWRSRFDEAEEVLEAALSDARQAQDPRTEARVSSNLGLVCFQRGQNRRARELHAEDLALCKRLDDPRGMARATVNLGLVSHRLGEAEDALRLFSEAEQSFEEIGHRQGQALALAYRGQVERGEGRLDRARDDIEKSLQTCREIGYRHGEAHAWVRLAQFVSHEEGRLETAWAEGCSALELARSLDWAAVEAEAQLALGIIAAALGQARQAEDDVRKALMLAEKLGARELHARADLELGRQLISAVRDDEARILLEEAGKLAVELGLEDVIVLVELQIAVLDDEVPEGFEPPTSLPLPAQAEAWLLLHRVTGGRRELERSRSLLATLSAHLDEAGSEEFWARHPVARAVGEAEAALG